MRGARAVAHKTTQTMSTINSKSKPIGTFYKWTEEFLTGETFWNLWGGRILNALIMSAVVAFCLQVFDQQVRQFVDVTVQSSLLNQLSADDFIPPVCKPEAPDGAAACITVVGVDDQDFRTLFRQQSPLDPSQLQTLFDGMRLHPPRALAVDLDLSPASESDLEARKKLQGSLEELSKFTPVIMVCPQGYSTPEPSALDKQWVKSFQGRAQFALADMDADGLYYAKYSSTPDENTVDKQQSIQALGVATAHALEIRRTEATRGNQALDWDEACKNSLSKASNSAEESHSFLIRPQPVNSLSFSQAIANPEKLGGQIVVVGGKWGVNDTFVLRGQPDHFFGVTLHAWVLASELRPMPQVTQAFEILLDVLIGLLAGGVFYWIWRQIKHSRGYAHRTTIYLVFFTIAVGVPLALIFGAVYLAKIGLSISVAGMILSSAADSFTSAHEEHAPEELSEGQALFTGLFAAAMLLAIATIYFIDTKIGVNFVTLIGFVGKLSNAGQILFFGSLGCALGLLFSWIDSRKLDQQVESNSKKTEKAIDLLFRCLVLFAKLAFLAREFLLEQEYATQAMQISFLGTWLIALIAWRKLQKRQFKYR